MEGYPRDSRRSAAAWSSYSWSSYSVAESVGRVQAIDMWTPPPCPLLSRRIVSGSAKLSLPVRGLGQMSPCLLLVTLLLPTAAVAQAGATLSGRALDAADRSPIGLATVVVVHAESGDTLSGTKLAE